MQMEISETHFKEPKQKKSDIIKFDIDDWFLNIIDLYFFLCVRFYKDYRLKNSY